MGEQRESSFTVGSMANLQKDTMEITVENSQKLKINLPYDTAIPQLGILPKDSTDALSVWFIAALFTIGRKWKQSKSPSTNKWLMLMWCVYRKEHNSAVKKMKLCKEDVNFVLNGWN